METKDAIKNIFLVSYSIDILSNNFFLRKIKYENKVLKTALKNKKKTDLFIC